MSEDAHGANRSGNTKVHYAGYHRATHDLGDKDTGSYICPPCSWIHARGFSVNRIVLSRRLEGFPIISGLHHQGSRSILTFPKARLDVLIGKICQAIGARCVGVLTTYGLARIKEAAEGIESQYQRADSARRHS